MICIKEPKIFTENFYKITAVLESGRIQNQFTKISNLSTNN